MNLLVMGKSYSGKSELIKIIEKNFGYSGDVLHIGDAVREKYDKAPALIPTEELVDIVDEFIHRTALPWIIDNPAKTIEQFQAVVTYLQLHNIYFRVIWVEDRRKDVDFKSRGRLDDENIFDKRSIWAKNEEGMKEIIKDEKIPLTVVENTDDGFLFKLG